MRKFVYNIFPICFFVAPLAFLIFFGYMLIKSGLVNMMLMFGAIFSAFFLGIVFGIWLDNDIEYDEE